MDHQKKYEIILRFRSFAVFEETRSSPGGRSGCPGHLKNKNTNKTLPFFQFYFFPRIPSVGSE